MHIGRQICASSHRQFGVKSSECIHIIGISRNHSLRTRAHFSNKLHVAGVCIYKMFLHPISGIFTPADACALAARFVERRRRGRRRRIYTRNYMMLTQRIRMHRPTRIDQPPQVQQFRTDIISNGVVSHRVWSGRADGWNQQRRRELCGCAPLRMG